MSEEKSNHYVDNKKLYAAIVEYRQEMADAIARGKEKPPFPEYVGKCIYLISNKLATKPNFSNYSYKEEMISDGIENCIQCFNNFDPVKYNNPFAYFTQIIYFAFLRRIDKEKKQLYIKHKIMENTAVLGDISEFADLDDKDINFNVDLMTDSSVEFVRSFEDNLQKKRQKKKTKETTNIEKFIEEEFQDEDIQGVSDDSRRE